MAAKAVRERYGCRSGLSGKGLAGRSDNIRSAVAYAESYLLIEKYLYDFKV